MEIVEKLKEIRKIVGSTVVFRIGMSELNKLDLLSMSVCQENEYKNEFEVEEDPDYVG